MENEKEIWMKQRLAFDGEVVNFINNNYASIKETYGYVSPEKLLEHYKSKYDSTFTTEQEKRFLETAEWYLIFDSESTHLLDRDTKKQNIF